MSNGQQPNEKKGPKIWHVLGIGGLIGVLLPQVIQIIFGEIGYLYMPLLLQIIPSIIGAAVGGLVPRQISKKWYGLWIGAILGSVIGVCLWVYALGTMGN